MIIDKKILEIVNNKGYYQFVDKDGKKYIVLPIDENGIIKNPDNNKSPS